MIQLQPLHGLLVLLLVVLLLGLLVRVESQLHLVLAGLMDASGSLCPTIAHRCKHHANNNGNNRILESDNRGILIHVSSTIAVVEQPGAVQQQPSQRLGLNRPEHSIGHRVSERWRDDRQTSLVTTFAPSVT